MSTITCTRPWIPPRPVSPPRGYLVDGDTYIVPGIATVMAHPHRSRHAARAFARRIARSPREYLPVLVGLGVAGIVDRRPVSHARGPAVDRGWGWERGPGHRPSRRPAFGPGRSAAQATFRPWVICGLDGRHADPRVVNPPDAAARSEAIATLSAALPPATATELADALAGGELSAETLAIVRRHFTRDQFAGLLGVTERKAVSGTAVNHG